MEHSAARASLKRPYPTQARKSKAGWLTFRITSKPARWDHPVTSNTDASAITRPITAPLADRGEILSRRKWVKGLIFFFFIQWKPTESFPLIDREVWYLLVSTEKKKNHSFIH